MLKAGFAYMLCFALSLIVGHALLILLSAYAPPGYFFFIKMGSAIDRALSIGYTPRQIAAFTLATLTAFPFGILFSVLLKVRR